MVHAKFTRSLSSLAAAVLIVLMLIYDEECATAVADSLRLCVLRIIPSLFPYAVIASVIISGDLIAPIAKKLPTKSLFSLPTSASSVILTGWLGGYPLGAVGTVGLYRDGKLTRWEASVLCAVSSVGSPSFLIGTVGGMWNSKPFGIFLYLVQILTVTVFFILFSRLSKNRQESKPQIPSEHTSSDSAASSPPFSLTHSLCKSITGSAETVLTVCAYITFFRVLETTLSALYPPATLFFKTLLEFSSGCAFASSTGGILGAVCTGFSVGFGGCSVFLQIGNHLGKENISLLPTFCVRAISAITMSLFSLAFYSFSPLTEPSGLNAHLPYLSPVSAAIPFFLLIFLVFFGKLSSAGKYFSVNS